MNDQPSPRCACPREYLWNGCPAHWITLSPSEREKRTGGRR